MLVVSVLNWVSGLWAEAMLRACWQGAVAIALVWLACRAWARMPGSTRCWLWRLAVLKILLALFWAQPVVLPVLPDRPAVAPAAVPLPAPLLLPDLPADPDRARPARTQRARVAPSATTFLLGQIEAVACMAMQAAQLFPNAERHRDLARQIVRVAGDLERAGDADGARALLIEGQRAASRFMRAEPQALIWLLVGIALDSIVTKPLETLLAGDEAALGRLHARREGLNRLREGAKETMRGLNDTLLKDRNRPITVWQDEGQMVRQMLAEANLAETIHEGQ